MEWIHGDCLLVDLGGQDNLFVVFVFLPHFLKFMPEIAEVSRDANLFDGVECQGECCQEVDICIPIVLLYKFPKLGVSLSKAICFE